MELLQNLQPRLVPMRRSLGFLSNTLQLVHSAYKRMFPRRYSTPLSQLGFQTQEWLLLFSFSPVFFFLPTSSAHSSFYSASFRSPGEPRVPVAPPSLPVSNPPNIQSLNPLPQKLVWAHRRSCRGNLGGAGGAKPWGNPRLRRNCQKSQEVFLCLQGRQIFRIPFPFG